VHWCGYTNDSQLADLGYLLVPYNLIAADELYSIVQRHRICIPSAPALDNTREEHLFRVICNVWTKAINDTAIVSIGT
jgi:hypothetical protein